MLFYSTWQDRLKEFVDANVSLLGACNEEAYLFCRMLPIGNLATYVNYSLYAPEIGLFLLRQQFHPVNSMHLSLFPRLLLSPFQIFFLCQL